MTNFELYAKYINLLLEVNDETKTGPEHEILRLKFYGWKQGVKDATGKSFNGDYYYIELFDSGEMEERPLYCGEFLDWKSKHENGVK